MFTTRRVLWLIVALLLIALLLIPAPETTEQRPTLTIRSATPDGARGMSEVLKRLGFRVQQRLIPMRAGLDTQAVYLVLDPLEMLTATEIHHLLETVRAGASLLTTPSPNGQVADSLAVASYQAVVATQAGQQRRLRDVGSPELERRWLRMVLRRHVHIANDTVTHYTPPAGAQIFASVKTEAGVEPSIVGFPYGRGRIIVAAEAELFSNNVFRAGDASVQVVRLIEWLQAGNTARPLVFDEYHQGFGDHANTRAATTRALTQTGPGRTALQLAAAGLLLLLALGMRPIKPQPITSIERRSALEHVGALARAYATVKANARATRLLVRGLRRRHGGLRGTRDEGAYLKAIAESHPEVINDVQVLTAAMDGQDTAPGNATVTTAILRIERAITS